MPYKVVSEISNTSENTFETINQFNEWYCDLYPVKRSTPIQMTIDDSMDQLIVEKSWDKKTQMATIARIYKSKERYERWEELFKMSGNKRHLEKVIYEVIV